MIPVRVEEPWLLPKGGGIGASACRRERSCGGQERRQEKQHRLVGASAHAPSGSGWRGPEGVEATGEGKVRKSNADLGLVFGLWTGGHGRDLEGGRNAATIILLNTSS